MTGFLQQRIPYGQGRETPVQEAVAARHLARVAMAPRGDFIFGYALFERDDADRDHTILLLSPDAAQDAHLFPGTWEPATDVADHEWSLLYGDVRCWDVVGLRKPTLPSDR